MAKIFTRVAAMVLVVMLLTGAAFATELEKERTLVPGTPTHSEVIDIQANWQDEAKTEFGLYAVEPDQHTIDIVNEAYDYVYKEGHHPVEYFPEETQKQIAELCPDVDIDALYITEMMKMHGDASDVKADLDVDTLYDVSYQPGQLVIVVIGIDKEDPAEDEEPIDWEAIKGEVPELGRITYTVDEELAEQLKDKDFTLSVLTILGADGETVVKRIEEKKHVDVPSKSAYDVIVVKEIVTSKDGEAADFKLLISDETPVIKEELTKLEKHIKEDELPAVQYLPEAIRDEMQLLLGEDVDLDNMVIYDYLPLVTEDYDKTFGDAEAEFVFATPYTADKKVVTVLALPKDIAEKDAKKGENELMDWSIQRAEVAADYTVDITFDQLGLEKMGYETGLMLVLSEKLDD